MQEKFCISLSSIPSRFQSVKEVINSLNRQTIKPDNIFLNIPFSYERFPEIKYVNIDTFKDIKDSRLGLSGSSISENAPGIIMTKIFIITHTI